MSGPEVSSVYEFGEFWLDESRRHLCTMQGRTIDLSSRAFDTLLYLLRHPGQLVDKQALMDFVWPNTVVEENNLSQAITALRKALGDTPAEHRYIVTDPGRGYRFVASVKTLSSEKVSPPAPSASAEASIAVLPFADMSPGHDQEYFSDGIAEELLNRLSKLSGLQVAGRTSAFSFKNKYEDIRMIGEKLNVAHVLEGSVRKAGDRVRVAVQLLKASDGFRLWSESFDRELSDIFAIQDEIAEAVASALSVTLGVGDSGVQAGGTRNFEAYDARLAAQALILRQGKGNFLRGIGLLEKSVALDPEYADAWSLLATAYLHAGSYWMLGSPDRYVPMSEQAAARAMDIAPGAVASLRAWAYDNLRRHRWLEAERHFRRAVEIAPGEVITNLLYAHFLFAVGRPHEAKAQILLATKADPLALTPCTLLAQALATSGEFDAALKELRRGESLFGNPPVLIGNLMEIGIELDDRSLIEKYVGIAEGREDIPEHVRALNRTIYSLLDQPRAARAELHRLRSDPGYQDLFSQIILSTWASYCRDFELALEMLFSLAERPMWLPGPIWQPRFRKVRRLPGFKELLKKLGLVDYWRETDNWGDFCRPLGDDDFECR